MDTYGESRRGHGFAWLVAGITALTVAAIALLAVSPAVASSLVNGRGTLISHQAIGTLKTKSDVDSRLAGETFATGTDRYGVNLYRLVYRTIDPAGRPTVASGLLALPRGGGRQLRVVSFAHGTEVYKADAPSTSSDVFLTGPAITFASAGYAAVAPDYLGLGTGPGVHPWMDVPSETTASVDLLRAAHEFATGRGLHLARDVVVSGFSQGASAALGLGRALAGGADGWFRLGALAPISGAYDFRSAQIPAALGGELFEPLTVAYLTYFYVAQNRLYHLYDRPGQVFNDPYAGRVTGLFDGTTPGPAVLGQLPGTVKELLTPYGRDLLAHPRGGMVTALSQMDSVCGWSPDVPVRLYFSLGDEEAANANTVHCAQSFTARGARVSTVDLGVDRAYNGFVHEGSELLGVAAVARWLTTAAPPA